MAAFDYEAINPKGNKEKGTIAAETLETARRELRNRKLAPLKVAEVNNKSKLITLFDLNQKTLHFLRCKSFDLIRVISLFQFDWWISKQ